MAPRLTATDVVDAAERLLDVKGVDALSARRLASELGASRQVVYTHFGGMNDLLDAVHLRAGEQLTETARTVGEEHGSDARVVAAAHAYLEYARRRPAAFALLFDRPVPGYVPSEETTRALRRAFRVHIVGLVEEWSHANAIPLDEVLAAERARLFWSAIHGLITLERAGHAEIAETNILAGSLIATLLAGWRSDMPHNWGQV